MIIDISNWNKVTDWKKVKATPGLEGVYIKACEGVSATDKSLIAHVNGCQSVGLPFGFYHFATLNSYSVVQDSTAEAKYFSELVKPYSFSLPLVLDIEKNALNLPKEKVLLYIQNFFSELEKRGFKDYLLYSYAPFLNENLPGNHSLGNIRLWLAAYTKKPILPKGWDKFWLWQYSSNGFINGVAGNVDLNKRP